MQNSKFNKLRLVVVCLSLAFIISSALNLANVNLSGTASFKDDKLHTSVSQEILDWGVDRINAERVWGGEEDAKVVIDGYPAGQGVNVLVIDSGINMSHPDLNYAGGYDFYNNDSIPEDTWGHGTHVAGIIGAVDNEIGVIGVAPKVNLYMARVSSTHGETKKNATAAVEWALDTLDDLDPENDIDIISMSWQEFEYQPLTDALNDAYDAGIILVAASGNYIGEEAGVYTSGKQVQYPANLLNVIAVGMVKPNNRRVIDVYNDPLNPGNQLEDGSCYGDDLDLVAPGFNIYSTSAGEQDGFGPPEYPDQDGIVDGYQYLPGTSQAGPMVVGVCALLLSRYPDLTPEQVKHILTNTADKVGGVVYDEEGRHQEYGYGMVNATAAVNFNILKPNENIQNHWYSSDYENINDLIYTGGPGDGNKNSHSGSEEYGITDIFEMSDIPFEGTVNSITIHVLGQALGFFANANFKIYWRLGDNDDWKGTLKLTSPQSMTWKSKEWSVTNCHKQEIDQLQIKLVATIDAYRPYGEGNLVVDALYVELELEFPPRVIKPRSYVNWKGTTVDGDLESVQQDDDQNLVIQQEYISGWGPWRNWKSETFFNFDYNSAWTYLDIKLEVQFSSGNAWIEIRYIGGTYDTETLISGKNNFFLPDDKEIYKVTLHHSYFGWSSQNIAINYMWIFYTS